MASPSLNNAPFQGAQKVLSAYAQRIYDAIQTRWLLRPRAERKTVLPVRPPND